MRKFRLDSASGGEILFMERKLWDRWMDMRATERMKRLLLHWWAVGHDPRRALNRCEDCWEPGCGVVKTTHPGHWESYDDIEVCQLCKGTGRAPVSEWRKL